MVTGPVSEIRPITPAVTQIALAGLDAETGVVMLLYLDQSFARFKAAGRMNSLAELQAAVEDGAVKRIRPKMMTVMAILMGLLPIMWSHGAGADVADVPIPDLARRHVPDEERGLGEDRLGDALPPHVDERDDDEGRQGAAGHHHVAARSDDHRVARPKNCAGNRLDNRAALP